MTPARPRTKAADHGLRLLTVKQVADLWQLNEGRVRCMCHVGQIRHIRIGRWIRIPSHTLRHPARRNAGPNVGRMLVGRR